jgi:molybdopterin synthase catalytic subunit
VAESYLTDAPIDVVALARTVMRPGDGASVVFEGAVRDHHEGKSVDSITYEAFRPMAEKEIDTIVRGVAGEFPDVGIAVRHRLGLLHIGDVSVAIVCTSPHRAEAFAACRLTIDRIKQTVPIWKKERGPEGEEWVGWQK